MSATLLMGKPIADKINEQIIADIDTLKQEKDIVPSLASVLVGDDPASKAYSGRQKKSAEKIGINYELHELPGDISENKLIEFIAELNNDNSINGIIIQMPLPTGISEQRVQGMIAQKKGC